MDDNSSFLLFMFDGVSDKSQTLFWSKTGFGKTNKTCKWDNIMVFMSAIHYK